MSSNNWEPPDEGIGLGVIALGIILALAIWGAILGGLRG